MIQAGKNNVFTYVAGGNNMAACQNSKDQVKMLENFIGALMIDDVVNWLYRSKLNRRLKFFFLLR